MIVGIGQAEVVVLTCFGLIVYWIMMLIDSIRRPFDRYKAGNKGLWITLLLSTILIPTRALIPTATPIASYLLKAAICGAVALAYHMPNRWNNLISKPKVPAKADANTKDSSTGSSDTSSSELKVSENQEIPSPQLLTLWCADEDTARRMVTDVYFMMGAITQSGSSEAKRFLKLMREKEYSYEVLKNQPKGGYDVVFKLSA